MKYIYTNNEGVLCLVHPVEKSIIEIYLKKTLTLAEYKAHIKERSIPSDATGVKEIIDEDIPSDRIFRNSWKDDGGKIGFNLDKCRSEIRECRNNKLKELDLIVFSESRKPIGGDVVSIDQESQRLRDIPQNTLFNSGSVDDLKGLMNSI